MKEYINLLPENIKEEIRDDKQFRNIVGGEFSFIFPAFLLIVILFAINLILVIQEEGLGKTYVDEQSQGGFQDLKKYEEKFQTVNSKINQIVNFQENHLEWSGILEKLSQTIPDGVSITGVATKDFRMFLIGRAETREKLLELQETINSSECFFGLNMPLSNLVSKKDVDFQMDFEIKKECLKAQ